MATILYFPVQTASSAANAPRESTTERSRRIAKAQSLILRAANLVEELGDKERRLSWILDDCADLLSRQLQSDPQTHQDHANGSIDP